MVSGDVATVFVSPVIKSEETAPDCFPLCSTAMPQLITL